MKLMTALLIAIWVAAPLPVVAQDARPAASDEDTIRQIVANLEADTPDPHVSADLDWENAFGVRYTNLKKRDAFYGAVVKPQFRNATAGTLETKVQFPAPDVAVADTYWHVAGQVYGGETKPGPDRWGRTTYIFSKINGTWTEVIELIADLRSPYYRHFAALPAASPVAPAILQAYSGHYVALSDSKSLSTADVSVAGDHLLVKGQRGVLTAIPTSPTDFLVFFDPDDVAEYLKASFVTEGGSIELKVSEAWDAPLATLKKQP